MKKNPSKAIAFLLAFAMLIGAGNWHFSVNVQAEASKTEVPEGYIGVYTPEDLDKVRDDLSGSYILMNDIEIPGGGTDENNYSRINTNFTPIGGNFTGIFDGNGYTLSNLFISDGALYTGLFSEVSGTIRNVNVYGVVSTYGDWYTGGIAGKLNDGGVIENCRFDGQVILNLFEGSSSTEPLAVGGIAGSVSSGRIRHCTNYGDVAISYDEYQSNTCTRATYVGGIAGQWDAGLSSTAELENCANYGNVMITNNGPAVVGGVLGYGYGHYGLDINACFNAGCLYVEQTETAAEKAVTVGGVVGELAGGTNSSHITNVYNTGYWDITSPADLCLGGVVGTLTNASLTGAYNTGTVFHDAGTTIGGIVGHLDDESTFETVYFPELYASACADAETADGRYTWEELRQSQTYDTNVFGQPTWILEDGGTYPYPQLSDNPFQAFRLGTGTEADPYQVRNMQELNAVRHHLSAHFRLMQDITCTTDHNGNNGYTNTTHPVLITGYQPNWYPIGSYRDQGFEGVFDGGGHTITGINAHWVEEDYAYDRFGYSISSQCYMGLFGCNRGLIQDLIVSNSLEAEGTLDEPYAGVTGYETISIVGGIAGYNAGIVRHCTNKTFINCVVGGGIVGENGGIIEQCINEAQILGAMSAGGIAAYNSQTIRECANTSYYVAKRGPWIYGINDETKQSSGGIAAGNTGRIENCYNTAQVLCETFNVMATQKTAGIANGGTIENCYNIGQANQPKCGTTGSGEPIGGKTMTNVYAWNMDGKGSAECFRTPEEMKRQETYVGFDFDNVWIMPKDSEYLFPILRGVETTFKKHPIGMVVTKKPSRHVFLIDEDIIRSSPLADGEYTVYYNDGTAKTDTFMFYVVYKQNGSALEILHTLETVGRHKVQVWPNQFLVFYYNDVFEAVDEKLPVGIEITQPPVKTAYYEGEPLDLTGLEVTVSYNTEQYETTDDYTLSPFDPNKIGTQTITVTYGDFVDTFEVEVMAKALSSIQLTTLPAKTDYIEGYEEFDPTGGKVTLTYSNGASEVIDLTANMVSGFDNTTLGRQTLTVTYNGKTATFEVTVTAKALDSIAVTKNPAKMTYVEGTRLDTTGMELTLTYNNGDTEILTAGWTETYDFSRTGAQEVWITYNDKTTILTVTVVAKTLTEIAVTRQPGKLTYLEGEVFDPTGLEVTAYYDNDTSGIVTEYLLSGFNSTPGTKTISVTYGGKAASFTVTVTAKSVIAISIKSSPDKTTYLTGDALDLTGAKITVKYNNNTQEDIAVTSAMVSGYNADAVGSQTITVTYAGKTAMFKVTVQSRVPSSITSSVYSVSGGYISKIGAGTTVAQLLNGINEKAYCKVYKGNAKVTGNTPVGTGMEVRLLDGSTVKQRVTVVVTGDTNGDGNITITDMLAVKSHLLKKTTLSGAAAKAADTSGDKSISITDFIQIKAHILGKEYIRPRAC